jgi:hypothetical protein
MTTVHSLTDSGHLALNNNQSLTDSGHFCFSIYYWFYQSYSKVSLNIDDQRFHQYKQSTLTKYKIDHDLAYLDPSLGDRRRKRWPFNTSGRLIEVTTWAGLTVIKNNWFHMKYIGINLKLKIIMSTYCSWKIDKVKDENWRLQMKTRVRYNICSCFYD